MVPSKAPEVPSYFSTLSFPSLATYRVSSGANARRAGLLNPPVTKGWIN